MTAARQRRWNARITLRADTNRKEQISTAGRKQDLHKRLSSRMPLAPLLGRQPFSELRAVRPRPPTLDTVVSRAASDALFMLRSLMYS
jgi:hypothetical protein